MNIKKSLSVVLAITAAITAGAQSAPGSWRALPMQGNTIMSMLDTPGRLYYISGYHESYNYDNSLSYYDKESGELAYATPGVAVTDGNAKLLRYNPAGKYTLVAYGNANIDLIYDSGKVVNLPEVKDARISAVKTINDAYFDNGRIYLATEFGFVIYDDANHVVLESAVLNVPVKRIAAVGDHMLLQTVDGTAKKLLCSPLAGRHNSLDKFKVLNESFNSRWLIDRKNKAVNCVMGGADTPVIFRITYNFDTLTSTTELVGQYSSALADFAPCVTGYYIMSKNQMVLFDHDGTYVETKDIPCGEIHNKAAVWKTDLTQVFQPQNAKIGIYDLSGAQAKTIMSPACVHGSRNYNNAYMNHTPDGRVLINSKGHSELYPLADVTWGWQCPVDLEYYDWNTGEVTQVLKPITDGKQLTSGSQAEHNKWISLGVSDDVRYGGGADVLQDPVDPSLIYLLSNGDGLLLVRDGDIIQQYGPTNSPLMAWAGASKVNDLAFDAMGNLWVSCARVSESTVTNFSPYKVITKDNIDLLRTNPKVLEEKQNGQYHRWQQPAWVDTDRGKCDPKICFSGNKGLKVDGSWNQHFIGIDTKGTPSVDDDVYEEYAGFTDQDGNTSDPDHKTAIITDRTGKIWIGTVTGVYVVEDLDQIGQGNSRVSVTRPKVSRNDGTEYADYLLATDNIMNIDVDANNNKWIATENSGVYQVSADGTRILQHFTTDNSPLRTNTVTTVCANPTGNDVLIGTPRGIYVYGSVSSPAADDFSAVKVYPNPVRPDYTGWVTIEGLMGNSLVKIADTQGNVIWSGTSDGGTLVWDGCDGSGHRVHSGVYLVLASSQVSGQNEATVAKIVFIN